MCTSKDPPIIPILMDDEGAKATVKDEGVTNISSSIDNVDFNKNNDKLKECLAGEEV